jgi:hypothetical protein
MKRPLDFKNILYASVMALAGVFASYQALANPEPLTKIGAVLADIEKSAAKLGVTEMKDVATKDADVVRAARPSGTIGEAYKVALRPERYTISAPRLGL